MTADDSVIGSEDVLQRRRAALELESSAQSADSERIRARLVIESDALVRERLKRALAQAESPRAVRPDESVTESLRVDALSELTDKFLHELRAILASVKRGALIDLQDAYGASSTARALERFASFLGAMEHLRDAARPPDPEDFNLVELVDSILATMREEKSDIELVSTREDPLTVRGDRYLLELALINGLRNAIDASPHNDRILVNCGETDREWWLNVLDNGEGVPAGSDQIFLAGRTTKPKAQHSGLGLTIAKQAIESMGGVVEVSRRTTTGTEFRLRWPKLS